MHFQGWTAFNSGIGTKWHPSACTSSAWWYCKRNCWYRHKRNRNISSATRKCKPWGGWVRRWFCPTSAEVWPAKFLHYIKPVASHFLFLSEFSIIWGHLVTCLRLTTHFHLIHFGLYISFASLIFSLFGLIIVIICLCTVIAGHHEILMHRTSNKPTSFPHCQRQGNQSSQTLEQWTISVAKHTKQKEPMKTLSHLFILALMLPHQPLQHCFPHHLLMPWIPPHHQFLARSQCMMNPLPSTNLQRAFHRLHGTHHLPASFRPHLQGIIRGSSFLNRVCIIQVVGPVPQTIAYWNRLRIFLWIHLLQPNKRNQKMPFSKT